jgi:hypothetical protein
VAVDEVVIVVVILVVMWIRKTKEMHKVVQTRRVMKWERVQRLDCVLRSLNMLLG